MDVSQILSSNIYGFPTKIDHWVIFGCPSHWHFDSCGVQAAESLDEAKNWGWRDFLAKERWKFFGEKTFPMYNTLIQSTTIYISNRNEE